jgi:hypothetical protein
MNMFEKLSDKELNMITNYIECNADADANSELSITESLSHIFRFWSTNKEDLFRVFGNELILTKKVGIAKPINMIEEDIAKMLGGYSYDRGYIPFYTNYNNWVRTLPSTDEWHRYELYKLLYASSLATNIWDEETFSIMTDDGHKLTMSHGGKITKFLGKVAKAFNIDGYEEFRIAHSQCFNQKKLYGELCISIHPLDYMTMSDNLCGWSSCMSWNDIGDYRQGTVEMMNSPYVVIAYLKSDEDMHINGEAWSNKKWRQLYIVTPHIITGIRQYPYRSDELNGITLQWLRELAQENGGWGPYEDTTILIKNYEATPIASLNREVTVEFSTNLMYNDFYAQHLSYVAPSIPDRYTLCFSGESECMFCGNTIDRNSSANLLACEDCQPVMYCYDCGERICHDDAVCVDGHWVCEYCYSENYSRCPLCEEVHHTETEMTPVWLTFGGIKQDDCYENICNHCLNSKEFVALFGQETTEMQHPRWSWSTYTTVAVEKLPSVEALDLFNIYPYSTYTKFVQYIEDRLNDEN